MKPLLEVRDLEVRFSGLSHPLIRNLSFTLHEGEIFGLVGESGCGKSLTSLTLLGLLPNGASARGDIRIFKDGIEKKLLDGEEFNRDVITAHISMIFQEPGTALNPVLKIRTQLKEAIHKDSLQENSEKHLEEALDHVRLSSPKSILGSYPHELSGGMKQRVLIAMALLRKPVILIADEPTTALDVTVQAGVLSLLRELGKEGLSILFITHDLAILYHLARRIAVMYAGEIVEEGPAGNLFEENFHPYTRGLMGSLPAGEQLPRTIPGVVPPPEKWSSGCRFSPRCEYSKDKPKCDAAKPPLVNAGEFHKHACLFPI